MISSANTDVCQSNRTSFSQANQLSPGEVGSYFAIFGFDHVIPLREATFGFVIERHRIAASDAASRRAHCAAAVQLP
jgi:hypothetical protein